MTYHPDPIPLETLFSTWVFLWVIIYCGVRRVFPQINTKWWDPTFAILFVLSYQLYLFIRVLFGVKPYSILLRVLVKFVIVTVAFKLLPLYFAWDHTVNWTDSMTSFVILFAVYIAYITYLRIDLFEIYDDLTESFIKDDNRIRFDRVLHIFYTF